MLPGRAVVAAGASRLRPAPDALAVAWSVTVLVRGRMVAPRPIAHRTAPLAARGIVAVFVLVLTRFITHSRRSRFFIPSLFARSISAERSELRSSRYGSAEQQRRKPAPLAQPSGSLEESRLTKTPFP